MNKKSKAMQEAHCHARMPEMYTNSDKRKILRAKTGRCATPEDLRLPSEDPYARRPRRK